MNTKESWGIICFRKNPTTSSLEVLMVKKRATYSFLEILNGHYDNDTLPELLDETTLEEKELIKSCNYAALWYHMWRVNLELDPRSRKNEIYYKLKSKFTTYFTDNREKMRALIDSRASTQGVWEFPKGRKSNSQECHINCAVREFYEETGMSAGVEYDFIYLNKPITTSLSSTRYVYNSRYYLGFTTSTFTKCRTESHEVVDPRWVNINTLELLDCPEELINAVNKGRKALKKRQL